MLRTLSNVVKSFGASGVRTVPLSVLDGLGDIPLQGGVGHCESLMVAALCRMVGARTFFEFGTSSGHTTHAVALNNPDIRIVTVDLPSEYAGTSALELTDHNLIERRDRGLVFAGTPEQARITQLVADSARFDPSPYLESMDVVYIDASHSYGYVRNDTEKALQMLSPSGTLVWHDYPSYPGVYAYLNEFAKHADRPVVHLDSTGLAVYSRAEILADVDDAAISAGARQTETAAGR